MKHQASRRDLLLTSIISCNSGADFDPTACVPAPAGISMRRVALTPHYDGVIRGHDEPAVIAICGIGPVNFSLSDP